METGSILVSVRFRARGSMPLIHVENDRPSGLIQKLIARGVTDLRQTISVLYGLCPIAHLCAMDLASAQKEGQLERLPITRIRRSVTLEAVLENLRVFLTQGYQLVGLTPPSEALRRLGRARAQLQQLLRLLVKDPYGESTQEAVEQLIRNTSIEAKALLEDTLFGESLERFVAELITLEALQSWLNDGETPIKTLLKHLEALPMGFAQVDTALMPKLTEQGFRLADEIYQRMRLEPNYDMMPILDDSPQLTGAIVKEYDHPLLNQVIENYGIGPFALTLARLLHTAHMLEGLMGSSSEGLCDYYTRSFRESQGAIAMIETARGLLTHALGIQPDETGEAFVPFYLVTSPTEWQFTPEGAALKAVQNAFRSTVKSDYCLTIKPAQAIALALFGLDPCVPIRTTIDELTD